MDDLIARLRPNREIHAMSAILLPFRTDGAVDWAGFEAHVQRTLDCGLAPAVNMDTGYVQLLDDSTKAEVLRRTAALAGERRWLAGAFVADTDGDEFDGDAYRRAAEAVVAAGGTPVIFPSWGLASLDQRAWVDVQAALGERVGDFIGFELGTMFVPNGRIVSLDAYRRLMEIPSCLGAKHSSLSRELEWDRLAARDAQRPEFMVLTGNDLAIDMVMWGSDYLLGLSTFAPEAFALRDRFWARGDARFFELNDLLQELGTFTFRAPVPGYRHDAAMFLHARGWIDCDTVPPGAVRRPESDRAVLIDLARRIDEWSALWTEEGAP
ncbi:MAG: dihydrodipicolinate synthase family protein [Actinobacteria bacterium]|nr:dihydrodipicolinate synthase family protein [Actinomycetota bacterium]